MFGIGAGVLRSLLFGSEEATPFFSTGVVMDTNDPDQMGRIRVRCAKFGDRLEKNVGDLPWAIPISPLAGVVTHGVRGVEQETIDAPVAYGMWNVPKTGSYVLVGCIDGDKSKRFYLGGLHPSYVTNTLPHGRYIWAHEESEEGMRPDGPMSANEMPIEPLYSNQTQQFTAPDAELDRRAPGTPATPRKDNAEYMSRGADMQASATTNVVPESSDNNPGSEVADHTPGEFIELTKVDGDIRKILSPGYGVDQIDPEEKYGPDTGYANYDSHNYSWTTPGFHSLSMNDRYDNCRIRLRTTSGHQILLDDTNERIYVSTAGGQTYIEIDKVGNIDIFAEKNISTHAKGDINFYTDKSFRVQALEGIHLRTDDEMRIHSLKDTHVRSEKNIRTFSLEETRMEANTNMHVSVNGGTLRIKTGTEIDMIAVGQMRLSSNAQMSLKSSDIISGEATEIHWNSHHVPPPAEALQAEEIQANWTTRVPDHEPWARVFMKESDSDATATDKVNKHTPEYQYTDALVGKGGRGDTYDRNEWWQR